MNTANTATTKSVATRTTCQTSTPGRTGASRGRGGRFNGTRLGGLERECHPSVIAVTRLIQRIWTAGHRQRGPRQQRQQPPPPLPPHWWEASSRSPCADCPRPCAPRARGGDRGEMSSATPDRQSSRAASEPFRPHGDAGIRALERGRVIHAVTGHPTRESARWRALTRRSLCSGLVRANTSTSSTSSASGRRPSCPGHGRSAPVRGCSRPISAPRWRRRCRMVAGDHLHADAGGAARGHAAMAFRAGRVR